MSKDCLTVLILKTRIPSGRQVSKCGAKVDRGMRTPRWRKNKMVEKVVYAYGLDYCMLIFSLNLSFILIFLWTV
jgi:hypothetical protein